MINISNANAYFCILLLALGAVPLGYAQETKPKHMQQNQSRVGQVGHSDNQIQTQACSLPNRSDASAYQRCGELSLTKVASQGISVVLSGGSNNNCTSVSLPNGGSVNSCLSNGISAVQICKRVTSGLREGSKQNMNIPAFQCEDFINGEKQKK